MLNQIIEENKNLIYSIIKKYTYYYDKEDLFQTATIGLIKAYNNYDSSKNTKFSTYAYTYILSEVLLYINNNRDIRLGKNYLKIYKKINEAKLVLTQKLMKEPTIYELSLFLELDENLINQVLALTQSFSNLEEVKHSSNQLVTLVDVNYDEYKKQHSMKVVRRNVTLPSWINYAADKSGINVSAVLANALKQELHLTDKF